MATENISLYGPPGTYNNWSANSGFFNYLVVDDPPGSPDDDTTYVKLLLSDGPAKDSYNLADRVDIGDGDTINSVTVKFRARHTKSSGTSYIKPMLRLSTTNNIGTQIGVTSSYGNYSQTISRPGGGSWTVTDLDSLQVGIEGI